MGGLILVFIAASLLFDLRWGNLWPMLTHHGRHCDPTQHLTAQR